MVKELRKVDGRIDGPGNGLTGDQGENLRDIIGPHLGLVGVQHECQLGVQLLGTVAHLLFPVIIQPVGENQDEHTNQQECHQISGEVVAVCDGTPVLSLGISRRREE